MIIKDKYDYKIIDNDIATGATASRLLSFAHATRIQVKI